MTTQVEVWVLIDSDGDYEIGKDAADAASNFDNNIGTDPERPTRLVKVLLTVPLPAVCVLSGTVPAEGEGQLAAS